jgi:hypothetical protein
MTVTDFVTFFLSVIFLACGASRGFMHSLTGPFSIIVTTIFSIIYFQITHDVITSLLTGLIGPLLLNLLLKFLLKIYAKSTNTEIKPDLLSRLAGSILTLIWGWVFIIFALILLTVLPRWGEPLTGVHDDVVNSASYSLAKPFEKIIFTASRQNAAEVTGETPNPDVKSLAEDPRFQETLKDPDIQKDIDTHDIVKLMKNPKMMDLVQKIMSDPATMKKVLAIYSSQSQSQATKNPQKW